LRKPWLNRRRRQRQNRPRSRLRWPTPPWRQSGPGGS